MFLNMIASAHDLPRLMARPLRAFSEVMPSDSKTSTDVELKLAFLERRLTLLEREFARFSARNSVAARPEPARASAARYACDAPGIMVSRTYGVEIDETGAKYCWIGNEGPIQIVAPFSPAGPGTCKLSVRPHHRVDISGLRLIVDDREREYKILDGGGDISQIAFPVPGGGGRVTNILLENIASVRPVDLNENEDRRLIAMRFFGVEFSSDPFDSE